MDITVKGVRIKLTEEQVKQIAIEEERRNKECKSFTSCLKYFGFKKVCTKGWLNPNQNCWNNEDKGWWAEIHDYGGFKEVWIVGKDLKEVSSFPGGYTYSSPEEIIEELIQHD